MTGRTAQSMVTQRPSMALATSFGVVALLLSMLGICGVLAYARLEHLAMTRIGELYVNRDAACN